MEEEEFTDSGKTIYLAGGMHTEWREPFVEEFLTKYTLIDPTMHQLGRCEEFTDWDLYAISISDIVVGYIDEDNPSGIGVALEMGYAKGLGKKTLFINNGNMCSKFDIVNASADVLFWDVESCINYLNRFYMIASI